MGITKAELTTTGNLKIAGNINTRLPAITNGLLAHFPFDGTTFPCIYGDIYYNNITWETADYVDGASYSILPGSYDNIILQADIYLEGTPSERYTVLKVNHPDGGNAMYLSIDSSRKVSVYDHTKTSNGYHASNRTLELNRWYTVTHINTLTETIIMIDGIIDRAIANTDDADKSLTGVMNIGAESSARHFQGKMRSLIVSSNYTFPITDTNTTLTNEGIEISKATTNLVPDPLTMPPETWTAREHVTVTENELDPFGGTNAVRIHPNSETDNYFGSRSNVLNSDYTYSTSVWVKATKNTTLTIIVGTSTGTAGIQYDASLTTEWQKFMFTGTPTTDPTHLIHFGGWNTWTDASFDIWVAYPQVENKAWSTSFIDGSKGDGIFEIALPSWGQEGTIYLEVASLYSLIPEASGTGDRAFIRSDTDNFIFYLNDGDCLYTTWGAGTVSGSNDLAWNAFEFHSVAYTFSKSSSRRKLFLDGSLNASATGWGDDYTWSKLLLSIRLGDNSSGDYIIKNLSLYNRELSENEIKAVYNSSFNLQTNGDLITQKIKTQPNMPDDVIYLPLSINGNDIKGIYSPLIETNIVYENGNAWVGDTITNLAPSPTNIGGTGWNSYNTVCESGYIAPNGSLTGVKITATSTTQVREEFTATNPETDTYYTFSVYAKRGSTPFAGIYSYLNPYNSSGLLVNLDTGKITLATYLYDYEFEYVKDGWSRLSITMLIHADQINNIFKVIQTSDGENASGGVNGEYVYYWGAQFEAHRYMSPFFNTTKGVGVLKYSLPTILTETNDWTVAVIAKTNKWNMSQYDEGCGRVNPIAVGNYYNVDEADEAWGHNWSSSGAAGLFVMLGYVNKSGRYSSSITLSEEDYSNWCMYLLKYDATANIIYGRIYGSSGTVYSEAVSNHTMVGLQPILRLGGYNWDEDNWDGNLRDAMVFNRMITDEESLDIWKIKLKQNNNLEIQNNLITGQAL